jgi:heme exporter protein CcmD
MIDWSADHISFVIVAYAIVALVLLVSVITTLRRATTLKQTLAEMKLSDPGQQDTV